jgi:hypothetical protein
MDPVPSDVSCKNNHASDELDDQCFPALRQRQGNSDIMTRVESLFLQEIQQIFYCHHLYLHAFTISNFATTHGDALDNSGNLIRKPLLQSHWTP